MTNLGHTLTSPLNVKQQLRRAELWRIMLRHLNHPNLHSALAHCKPFLLCTNTQMLVRVTVSLLWLLCWFFWVHKHWAMQNEGLMRYSDQPVKLNECCKARQWTVTKTQFPLRHVSYWAHDMKYVNPQKFSPTGSWSIIMLCCSHWGKKLTTE